MKVFYRTYFILTLFLFCFLFIHSCKKNDGDLIKGIAGQFKLNNIDQHLDSAIATLDTSANFIDGYYERKLVIYLYSGSNSLRLTGNDWTWENPPINGVNIKSYMTCMNDTICNNCIHSGPLLLCDGSVLDWMVLPYIYSSVGVDNGYVDIISNDVVNKTINCQFLAKLIAQGQTDTLLVQGEIQTLSYRIKN